MIILLTTFLVTSGSVEKDRLKGINIPSHTKTKLDTMKIWKAKCIVLIHRKQIVSEFSISCTSKRAFLFAKAHNPAVDASGRSGRKSRRKGITTGRALLATTYPISVCAMCYF